MEVKTSDQITEEHWAFLEKELEQFQRVLKDLEDGPPSGSKDVPDAAGGESSDSTLTNSPPKSPDSIQDPGQDQFQDNAKSPPPIKGEKPKLMPKPALKPKPVLPKQKPIPPPRTSTTTISSS